MREHECHGVLRKHTELAMQIGERSPRFYANSVSPGTWKKCDAVRTPTTIISLSHTNGLTIVDALTSLWCRFMKTDFTRTTFHVPPLLRAIHCGTILCVCVHVRQTSAWLIGLLVSSRLIFQLCCLRPVAFLSARCRCVSPLLFIDILFP